MTISLIFVRLFYIYIFFCNIEFLVNNLIKLDITKMINRWFRIVSQKEKKEFVPLIKFLITKSKPIKTTTPLSKTYAVER